MHCEHHYQKMRNMTQSQPRGQAFLFSGRYRAARQAHGIQTVMVALSKIAWQEIPWYTKPLSMHRSLVGTCLRVFTSISGRIPKVDVVLGFGWEILGRWELVPTAVTWKQITVPLRLVFGCITPWNGWLQTECQPVTFRENFQLKSTQMYYAVIFKLLCSFFFIRHNLIAELRRNKAYRSKCMQIQLSATHLRSSSIPHLGFIL